MRGLADMRQAGSLSGAANQAPASRQHASTIWLRRLRNVWVCWMLMTWAAAPSAPSSCDMVAACMSWWARATNRSVAA